MNKLIGFLLIIFWFDNIYSQKIEAISFLPELNLKSEANVPKELVNGLKVKKGDYFYESDLKGKINLVYSKSPTLKNMLGMMDTTNQSESAWYYDWAAQSESENVDSQLVMKLWDANEDGKIDFILQIGVFFGPSPGYYLHAWNESKQKFENQSGAAGDFNFAAFNQDKSKLILSYAFMQIDPTEASVNQVFVYDFKQAKIIQNEVFYFAFDTEVPGGFKRFFYQPKTIEYTIDKDSVSLFPSIFPGLRTDYNLQRQEGGSIARIPKGKKVQIIQNYNVSNRAYSLVMVKMPNTSAEMENPINKEIRCNLWHGMNYNRDYWVIGWMKK